jgi:hypothetical protein
LTLYVPLPTFRSLSVIPGVDVDGIESENPGYIEARSGIHQDWLEAVLAKRYAIPFTDPVPGIVKGWIVALVTPEVYGRRGFNPSLAELQPMLDASTRAVAEVKEAANSQTGMFELPLREGGDIAGSVTKGGPQFYSETSPYVSMTIERCNASREDSSGRGT